MAIQKRFLALAFLSLAASAAPAQAADMSVSSSAFEDGGAIPARYAGPAQCGGENVSLPVA